jgi:hypothetical protein
MKRWTLILFVACLFPCPLNAELIEPARLRPPIKEPPTLSLIPEIEKKIPYVPMAREEDLPLIERLTLDMAILKEVVEEKWTSTEEEIVLEEPGKVIDIDLPLESRLTMQGRKMVRIRYGDAHYIDREVEEGEEEPIPPTSLATGIQIDQELQARVHGVVRQKIHVDIDYDDTREGKQQKFWIAYKGEPDEIVQEAAFGDLTLSLPTTEFVAYSKSLFGARVDLKLGDLRLMGVGSRTKGITEKKEFLGKTTQHIKDIPDTNFRKRKYYQLLGDIPKDERRMLPIRDVEIYIDDKDATNDTASTITLKARSHDSVDSYEGKFDKQYPFDDYVINYQTGVLTFRKTINANHVIAVAFKDKDGNRYPATDYRMIKCDYSDFPSITEGDKRERYGIFELKGYYSLGHTGIDLTDPDFLLQIRNMNNEPEYEGRAYLWIFGLDRDNNGRIDPAYIDTELGLISFPANTPFDLRSKEGYHPGYPDNEEEVSYRNDIDSLFPSASIQESISNTALYDVTSPTPKYQIHIEYKSVVREYFIKPFIVEGSEKVYVNGVRMERDIHYLIDYESGWITFIGDVEIDEDTEIKVEYEYMPFGGAFQKTLLGGRLEYKPNDSFHLGSTYIYEGATEPETVPKIGRAPDSLRVLDMDTKVKAFSIIKEAFGLEIPLEVDIQAEAARSWRNPNLFGAAMVESMQGVETALSVGMDYKGWSLGFGHNGILRYRDTPYSERAGPYNEEEGHLEEEEVEGKERSLVLRYELASGEKVVVVSALSRTALDLSEHRSLELWTKGFGEQNLYIEVGILNEDADEDGVLDTEDRNGDGLLNPGEDVGWEFNPSGALPTRVGVANGKLDTEDLDGDGRLNSSMETWVDEGYFELKLEDKYKREPNPDTTEAGWIPYSFPLKDAVAKGTFSEIGEEGWTLIRHIRIRVEGAGSGEIYIDSIEFMGNRWERGRVLIDDAEKDPLDGSYFEVGAMNSEDDPDYQDLKDEEEFEDLYRGEDLDELKEETLVLRYGLEDGEIGTTKYVYKRARDYSRYRGLRFWLHGDGKGVDFFIRFGADEKNHFGERVRVNFHGWRLIEIDLRRSKENWMGAGEYKGNPYMSNIRCIQLGVYGNGSSGEIWVNEIHLTDPETEEGRAHRIEIDASWADWLKVRWEERYIESDFLSVGMTSPQQDTTTQGWGGELSVIKWLPMTYRWSRSTIKTDPEKVEDVIMSDLGTKREEKEVLGMRFLLEKWPKLATTYQRRDADVTYQETRRLEDEEIFTGEISHTLGIPVGHRFEIAPRYKQTTSRKLTTYPEKKSGDIELLERIHDGGLGLKVDPSPSLNTTSSVGFRERLKREETDTLKDDDYKLQTRSLDGNFGVEYRRLAGVLPRLDGSADFDETYSYTYTIGEVVKKRVNSSSTLKLKTKLSPKEWSPSLGFIDFDHTFTLDVKANYSDLPGEEKTWETLSKVYNDYYTGQLFRGESPPPTDISKNRTSASNTRKNRYRANLYIWDPMSLSLSHTIERTESQSQSSIIFKDSMSYEVSSRLRLDEAFGLFRRITTSSHLIAKYRVTEKVVRDISITTTTTPQLSWQANWSPRFRTTLGMQFSETLEVKGEDVNIERSTSPKISLNYFREKPLILKIPFIKRKVRLEQRLETGFGIEAEFKERIETDVPKEKTNKYNVHFDLKYDIQKNMRGILGLKGEYLDDELEEGNDYYAWEGSLEVEFRF